ncbi:MAG TPA: FdhF/YdeP family oxidoreductase [Flavobacteriales bacterium]
MEKREFVEGAETPEEFTGLKKTDIKKFAAGFPAVLSSAKMVFSEAGVFRGLKALNNLNQKDGFDCPSCAWPDPDDERSRLGEYCENGARAVAEEATAKRLTAEFFAQHSVKDLAKLSDYEIGKKGRIAEPVYLPKGATHYQPISWDDAFAKIGTALNKLASPNEAIFYTSGRTSNEAAFLYQLFIREYGTNNLPDCSNMCHESSGSALGESLGLGKGSVTLHDFYDAEVIIVLGQNPGTNHPRMMSALKKAKKNGAIIISVNPIPEPGLIAFANPQEVGGMLGFSTPLSDYYYQIRINGDMALLQAVTKLLIEEDEKNPGSVFDHAFIKEKTLGYEELIAHIKSLDFDVLVKDSGITESDVRQLADVLKNKNRIIACWAMGLTQHKNAVDTIKEIVNLLLLKGSIGKKGAGTCPVRGHSNVQGDRTVGIYERPPQSLLDAIERNFHFKPPQEPGYDVVAAIKAMYEKRASVFFAMGGNFLSATPDTNYTAKALQNCALTVHVSTKLNRSHLIHGEEAIILPCLARTDIDMTGGKEPQFVTCENSMGVVQMSKGVLKPVSDKLLSEPEIVVRLAKATLGARSKVNWDKYLEHYDNIRDDIERTIPGFEKYNLRVRVPGGFYLPNPPREGNFATPTKKAHFNIAHIQPPQLKDNELMMMTIRTHDQFNTTVYGLNDRYRGIYNERRVILMNEKDIARLGFADGEVVDLYNNFGGVERVARKFIIVKYPIAERCAATYFPETNVLVPIDSVADKSHTPTSKMVILTLKKSA